MIESTATPPPEPADPNVAESATTVQTDAVALPPADLFSEPPSSSEEDSGDIPVSSLGRVSTSIVVMLFHFWAEKADYAGLEVDEDEQELWNQLFSLALKEMDKKLKKIYQVALLLLMKRGVAVGGYLMSRSKKDKKQETPSPLTPADAQAAFEATKPHIPSVV